jgi:hypothetical protein
MKMFATIMDTNSTWQYYLVMTGAIAVPGAIAFIWVVAFRKKARRKIRRHRNNYHSAAAPINPTLHQTGGLPPLRKPEDLTDQPKS